MFVTVLFSRVLFARSFDFDLVGEFDEAAYSITQTTEGGYAVAGLLYMSALIFRLDSSGNLVWAYSLKPPNFWEGASFRSVTQTADRGYAVAGSHSYAPTHAEILVLKMDSSGNLSWAREFGLATSYEVAHSIVQTTDGGYAVAGMIIVPDSVGPWPDSMDFFVLKTDPSGNPLWARKFGRIWDDEMVCYVAQTTDGGLVVAGHEKESMSDALGITVIKMDEEGNLIWARGFGWGMAITSITRTADGGVALLGFANEGALVLMLDSYGNLSWARTFSVSGNDRAQSAVQTSDEGFVVAGVTANFQDLLLIKIDPSGNLLWARTFREWGNGYPYATLQVTRTMDGGHAIAGYSFPIKVLKLDENGDYPGCVDTCWPIVDTPEIELFTPAYFAQWTPDTSLVSLAVITPGFTVTDLCPPAVAEKNIGEPRGQIKLLPGPGGFYIAGYEGPAQIYNPAGRLVLAREIKGKTLISPLRPGVYFVVAGNQRSRVAVR